MGRGPNGSILHQVRARGSAGLLAVHAVEIDILKFEGISVGSMANFGTFRKFKTGSHSFFTSEFSDQYARAREGKALFPAFFQSVQEGKIIAKSSTRPMANTQKVIQSYHKTIT